MKYISYLLLTLLAACAARAASLEGEVKLEYCDSMFSDKAFQKQFGDVVKAECRWYVGDFFSQETVFAGVTLTNSGAKPMFVSYYVAFFDKDKKLVGAAAHGSFANDGLKPGKKIQLGSCLIHLPKDKYKDIASYQAVIYETDTAPKQK